MKKVYIGIVVFVGLMAVSGSSAFAATKIASSMPRATTVAAVDFSPGNSRYVYKFVDGKYTCYVTETNAISCVK